MLMFSKSEVDSFRHTNTSLRYGQQFYQKFKLEKVTNPQDKEFCDRLYYADNEKAKQMIRSRTDKTQ